MTTYTAFKYNETHETEDLFTVNERGKAIALAIGGNYDEVVNDRTGEVIWTKEKGVVSMENIYDTMELGGTYHDDNGKNYIILAFDKDADVAIFLNPKNSFTPYVGAKFVHFDSWGSGHYFKTIQEACDWFDKEIGGEDLTEKEDKTRADICITNENENGTGEYFSYKKSAMDRLSNMIDEVLAENPNAEIDIAIEYDA